MLIKITCSSNMGGTTTAIKLLKPEEKVLIIGDDGAENIFKKLYSNDELFKHLRHVDKINVSSDKALLILSIHQFIKNDTYETLIIDNVESYFNKVELSLIEEWMKELHSSKKRCIIVKHETPPINLSANF